MKFKMAGLLLSASLVLAACSSEDDENASSGGAETDESNATQDTANEETGDDQETGTDMGGTEQDAATEENTPDDSSESDDNNTEDTGTQSGETTTGDPSAEGSETNNTMVDSSSAGSETIALEDISLTADDAISIAEGEAEGDIHEISFEENGEGWVYNIDINNGSEESEVVVDHDTEEVLDVRTEQEDDDDNNDQDEVVDYGSLSEAYDAIDEAIADLGGGEVKEWTLSMDDGVAEYNIDLVYENQTYEYKINAETLEILETEQDD